MMRFDLVFLCQFVDEENVAPLCSARPSLEVVEQRKNRHVMSGIRKKVMGNGEVGQTKEGGCVACEDSSSIFTKGIMDP